MPSPALALLRTLKTAPPPHTSLADSAGVALAALFPPHNPAPLSNLPGFRLLKQESGPGHTRTNAPALTLTATLAGEPLLLKLTPARGLSAHLKRLARATRAHRQWDGALRLAAAGFDTPTPLLLASVRLDGHPADLLVTRYLRGQTLIEHLAARSARPATPADAAPDRALADAVGRHVAQIVRAGLFNRDHKPSNLLILDPAPPAAPSTSPGPTAPPPAPALALLDTVAIRRARSWDLFDAPVAMLTALTLEPLGCRCLPSRTLRVRALRALLRDWNHAPQATAAPDDPAHPDAAASEREGIALLWSLVAARVAAHGDPTPKVSPLPFPPPPAPPSPPR
jgi:hypothetical protein